VRRGEKVKVKSEKKQPVIAWQVLKNTVLSVSDPKI
jgi:hypothetical protein